MIIIYFFQHIILSFIFSLIKLIILGDASTLTKHPFYKKLYEYIYSLQTH